MCPLVLRLGVPLGAVLRDPEDLGIPPSEKHSCRALWEVEMSREVRLFKVVTLTV